jgi:hypothetical protein
MCHFNSDSSRFFLQPLVPLYTMRKVFNEKSRAANFGHANFYTYHAIENKKNRNGHDNTFQLAARKNLIQMSSDVITTITVIINY